MRRMLLTLCAASISFHPLFAQGITLAGTGYADPSVIRVAPGQITTLFVTGLKTVLSTSPVNANTVPLPTMLAGISVTLNQTTPIPLLSIQQMPVCNAVPPVPPPPLSSPPPSLPPSPDCLITAITVQIPFDLPLPGVDKTTATELVVSENGNMSKAFGIVAATDNLHVLNTCDLFPSPKVVNTATFQSALSASSCQSIVTHGNGNLITADDPAQGGEEVVIWAYGLGQTSPAAKTGQASPTPAATLSSFLYFQFDFRINAAPSRPYINPLILIPIQLPIFAGLTPGQVGLYQINLRIPNPIPAVPGCGLPTITPGGTPAGPPLTVYNIVQSNLTIDLGAPNSFDGAAICVKPTQ